MEDAPRTPRGKYAATLTIGPKGQIVIPKGARDLFGYKPGDQVLLLADVERGIVIMPASALADLMGGVPLPSDPPEED
ncbi:AbrB/MazE/SpoVT family DNA-binding domain-containing protein [Rhodococcus chondri]|uniref:AbrB/MazE/SpoVT family DNA-binding domain-containing protein n=1 Tax=Rhodococcus chondri TaxID=3065941 RepID=A0ABU7JMB5_9NOCA|nr:AbrB/MazE/SpoVT family DNA-binding domain-containing protein [Rhodococcus sp. CC-R104]MEE2031176.1 AbrB/MazE/SpoVT family DNA-binding domain-containing protein [Rhodococcus sp. CC-R104]